MLRPATRPLGTAECHNTSSVPATAGVGGLGDVAGREDVLLARAQVVVDEDAAAAVQAGSLGKLYAGSTPIATATRSQGISSVAGLHGDHPALPAEDAGELGEGSGSARPRVRSPCSTAG